MSAGWLRSMLAALLPRRGAALFGLLGIGLAYGYAIETETPVGSLQGRVVLSETGAPLGEVDVVVTPADPGASRRRAVTDSGGRFHLAHLPAGEYKVTAYAEHHTATDGAVIVDEGEATPLELRLNQSQPSIELSQHQWTFGTTDNARVSVRGYVNPAAARGQDTVAYKLYRTRLSSVMLDEKATEALDRLGDNEGTLPSELMKPAAATAPNLFRSATQKIDTADREGFYYQRLDFGRLDPGLYLLEVGHREASGYASIRAEQARLGREVEHLSSICAWVLVTDVALIVKRSGRQMLAYAVDFQQGTPIAGADVRFFRDRKPIARAATDARGLVQIELPQSKTTDESGSSDGSDESDEPSRPESSDIAVVASRGQDEAVYGQQAYDYERDGRFAVHQYTDRPIYRPGQRVYFKGIVRRTLDPGAKYMVPANEAVAVEMRDPSGDSVLKTRLTTNGYGSYAGQADLSPEAPTGVYTLVTTIRGEKHTHDFTIASYRKPEFTVTVTPKRERYIRGEEVQMEVRAEYYFGGPVAGAKVAYEVYAAPDWSADYPDEYGYDANEDEEGGSRGPRRGHGRRYYGYFGGSAGEGEVTLDENGRATVTFPGKVSRDDQDDQSPIADEDTPQEQTFRLHATVTDEAKREVEGDAPVQVAAGDFRVSVSPAGYLAEPGKPLAVTLEARTQDHKPVAGVRVDLHPWYEEWRRGSGEYVKRTLPQLSALTGADGKVVVSVTPPRSGSLRLAAVARDGRGRAIHAHGYVWCAGDEGGDMHAEYADLALFTDKRRYRPGESARVLINAGRAGETVLLTIEGSKIASPQLVPMRGPSAVVHIPVLAEYGPNVYLAACYVRDKKFARSETPLRVNVPERALKVEITSDKPRYHPAEKAAYTIHTTDSEGKPAPCELSFGVVDESIYALQEEDPDALRDSFYPRRYNSVETGYSFAVQYLGPADKAEPKISARKKFLDTAYWDPFLQTDAAGIAHVTVTLPDNLTTWRATATAHTLATQVGRVETKVVAAKEFFVRVDTPRFLTQHDNSRVTVVVHNDTGAPQTAIVRIRARGLTLQAGDTQTVKLESGAARELNWPVQADLPGDAVITVTAWTPSPPNPLSQEQQRGSRTSSPSPVLGGRGEGMGATQWTDGVETTVTVRPHGRDRFESYAGELTASRPEIEILRLDPAAIPSESRLTLRINPSITSAAVGALDYLVGYPYGCTEQTMSRFLPDLLVQRLPSAREALSPSLRNNLPRMVRDSLTRLYRFQHESGAWGWWEHDTDDAWMTAYVLYGLAEAKTQGVAVNQTVLEKAVKGAIGLLGKSEPGNRAFLLYAVALAGDRETALKQRDAVVVIPDNPESIAYAILLNSLVGEPPSPNKLSTPALVDLLAHAAVSEGVSLHWKQGEKYADDWNTRTATSAAIRALMAVNPRDPRVGAAVHWLMISRTDSFWYSTRDTTWALAALADYLAGQPQESASGEVRVSVNGAPVQTLAMTPELMRKPEVMIHVPASALRPGKNELKLERTAGGGTVFYAAQLRQTVASEDMAAISGPQSAGGSVGTGGTSPVVGGGAGVKITREMLRVMPKRAGGDRWSLQTEPANGLVHRGDVVRVRLTLDVPKAMSHVLIEDRFPAGLEVNERGEADEQWTYWYSSTDVRDDRIAFFARTLPAGKHVIEYNLRAQTPGVYHTLPALLESMYAPELHAESAETRLEVR